jgi:hypothetical protein
MPKVITDRQTRDICKMISTWDTKHPLDWITICLGAQEILGWESPPTRQALSGKTTVKLAYQSKKSSIKKELERVTNLPRPKTIRDGAERIARLEEELAQAKALNNKLYETITRLLHNAGLRKFTKAEMMKAPTPVKEQSRK